MSGPLTISISGTPARLRVDQRITGHVHVFSGVLFHVDSLDATRRLAVATFDFEIAVLADRLFVLADLVALGQIGIEIVLAREDVASTESCNASPARP